MLGKSNNEQVAFCLLAFLAIVLCTHDILTSTSWGWRLGGVDDKTPTTVIMVEALNLQKFAMDRRRALLQAGVLGALSSPLVLPTEFCNAASVTEQSNMDISQEGLRKMKVIHDPESYSALTYSPPTPRTTATNVASTTVTRQPPPLILVLHGAGKNDLDIVQDLANPQGEHAGLIPSLIEAGAAPSELLDNFAILAPYSFGKTSFYQDSRSKLLKLLNYASSELVFDPSRIFLFGFSDGATVTVELLTTRRFAGAVICSYGYSGGTLPAKALERLSGIPIWVFHSADDVIFNIEATSDRLVEQLMTCNNSQGNTASSIIRYNRYDRDPENLPSRVRGHSMGITASKLPEVYTWMSQQPPLSATSV